VRTSRLAKLLKNCYEVSSLCTINYVVRVRNVQVMGDIRILCKMQTKRGNSGAHLSNRIIFRTVRILKPNLGQVHWGALREIKVPKLIKIFHFLEVIPIHMRKLQYHFVRLYSAIHKEL
jgi:hypothetical protein